MGYVGGAWGREKKEMKREHQREKWLKTGTRRAAVSGGDERAGTSAQRAGLPGPGAMDRPHRLAVLGCGVPGT